MIRTFFKFNKRGFSLLEVTLVMIVTAALASAAIPALTQQYMNMAEQKTALDINNIQSAALAYYVRNSAWPTSITPVNGVSTDLETSGFLPAGWNATNPFGNLYTISSSGSLLTVSSQVASSTQSSIIYQLPTSSYNGNVVSSSIPVPGITASGFGQWQSINFNQNYTAPTDGFVTGSVYLRGGISGVQQGEAEYFTATSCPPTTNSEAAIPIYLYQAPGQTNGAYIPFHFPVRKNDCYALDYISGNVSGVVLYYLPS